MVFGFCCFNGSRNPREFILFINRSMGLPVNIIEPLPRIMNAQQHELSIYPRLELFCITPNLPIRVMNGKKRGERRRRVDLFLRDCCAWRGLITGIV